jgi:PAS domain S-box-containing protein
VIFLVLAGLTLVVSNRQVSSQRQLLSRHTEDVAMQAARRLELFVEFRLATMRLFARRWATHELRDYSRKRFEQFAQVMLHELPGYHAIRLVPPDLSGGWLAGAQQGDVATETVVRALLEQVRASRELQVSPPVPVGGDFHILAAQAVLRDGEQLGFLVVEFNTRRLIDACFQARIRAEFAFEVRSQGLVLYRYTPAGLPPVEDAQERFRARHELRVLGARWELSMLPRHDQVEATGWRSGLSTVLFGLALSVGLVWLVALLSRRMDLFLQARDRAVSENQERARAELALRASESRYRSIFDSATDGFVILDLEGKIRTANRAAHEMHGRPPESLRGLALSELLADEHRKLADDVLRTATATGQVRLEAVHRRADGARFDVEVRGSTFRYGDEPRVLLILSDVSERKRAQERQALLSRKVLVAQEEERSRISRELHDELGQLLTALRFEIDWLRKRMARGDEQALGSFANSVELVEKAAAELRRICKGLRPPLLDDLGLDPASRLLVDEFRERTGIDARFTLELGAGQRQIPPEIALAVYRVLQESLTNVSRHSGASAVEIGLRRDASGEIALVVVDNGRGFDPASPALAQGSGMAGMRERSAIVDGRLEIRSSPGHGTSVEFRVPLAVPPRADSPAEAPSQEPAPADRSEER